MLLIFFMNIGSFEKQCVILKRVFKYEQLKQHMTSIGTRQSLIDSALYTHFKNRTSINYKNMQVNVMIGISIEP